MKTTLSIQRLLLTLALSLVVNAANAQQPPTADLVLWLKADAGVSLGNNLALTKWGDQGGGILNDGSPFGGVGPHLGEVAFSNGPQPAIIFNGQGLTLDNPDDLDLTNLSIYVVASISQAQSASAIIGTYAPVSGWALGIADGVQNRIKWFSAGASQLQSMEPAGADFTVGIPAAVTATFSNDTKSLYFNTNLIDSQSGLQSPKYLNGHQLTVGMLTGGSQLFGGAIAEILVYSSVSDSQRQAVEQYLRRKYFGAGTGPLVITSQPVASQTVNALNSAAFVIAVDGAPPISYQWRKNGVDIPGATNIDYLISSVAAGDAGSYTVAVSNSVSGLVVSGPGVLNVNSDLTPPQVITAGRDFAVTTTAVVTFSEPVSAATATNAANYTINNGVTVDSAVMNGNAAVVLTTSAITNGPAYTLTVNDVQDLVGNPIASNSTIALQVPAPISAQPPATNMVLWLKADDGVTADATGLVSAWTDRAVGGNDNSSQDIVGTPMLKEAAFPHGGFHQVVRLDGASGFHLSNASDADLQEFSIYIVASVANNNQSSEIFISDWPGMAFGISDGSGGVPKYVTYGPINSFEPAAARMASGVPAELAMTFSASSGTKAAYFNGTQVAQATNLTISYAGGSLTVGMLFATGGQTLNGDIAEILVYSAVSPEQDAAVTDYLAQKYFAGYFRPTLSISRAGSNLNVLWQGSFLQSADQPLGPWTNVNGATNPFVIGLDSAAKFFRCGAPQ